MSNLRPVTAEDTVGPYYPWGFVDPEETNLVKLRGLTVRPRGEPIRLSGTVREVGGKPLAPVLVEFWQANADGRYRTAANTGDPDLDPLFDGISRQYCSDGRFDLTTIRPGSVPGEAGETPRAPHITVTIFSDGIWRVVTQIFFEGEPLNDGDVLLQSVPEALRSRLIARRIADGDGVANYTLDIILRGDGETPFFDDMQG